MDKLEERISAQRATVDDLKRRAAEIARAIEVECVRLDALLEAAVLREVVSPSVPRIPATGGAIVAQKTEKRGGRQQGAVDAKWRDYWAELVQAGNEKYRLKVFVANAANRLGMEKASVRVRVRNHIEAGHLTFNDDFVSVSEAAIERFRLSQTKTTPPNGEAVNGYGAGLAHQRSVD